jgi:hypothetical protein
MRIYCCIVNRTAEAAFVFLSVLLHIHHIDKSVKQKLQILLIRSVLHVSILCDESFLIKFNLSVMYCCGSLQWIDVTSSFYSELLGVWTLSIIRYSKN